MRGASGQAGDRALGPSGWDTRDALERDDPGIRMAPNRDGAPDGADARRVVAPFDRGRFVGIAMELGQGAEGRDIPTRGRIAEMLEQGLPDGLGGRDHGAIVPVSGPEFQGRENHGRG